MNVEIGKEVAQFHFLLQIRLSIRGRNFGALNEPQNIFFKFNFNVKVAPIKTLWCKKHENPSDRKSHTWAPLRTLLPLQSQLRRKSQPALSSSSSWRRERSYWRSNPTSPHQRLAGTVKMAIFLLY
jgi:hypothetical protein